MTKPKISIIVPSYNSRKGLMSLLRSLSKSNFKHFEVIINDSKKSTDNSKQLVSSFKRLKIKYITQNLMMAQARKQAVKYASGEYLLHIDSDMTISKRLLEECSNKLEKYDALVIPEASYGNNFWAKCIRIEKEMYEGNEHIESIRAIRKKVYDEVGGHDPNLIFSEDKDLDLRVRAGNYKIGRTKNYIYHNEGSPAFWKILSKKAHYSKTSNLFAYKHPGAFRWQMNIFYRYMIFIKNIKFFFFDPLHYLGLIFLKTMEYFISGFSIFLERTKEMIKKNLKMATKKELPEKKTLRTNRKIPKKLFNALLLTRTIANVPLAVLDKMGLVHGFIRYRTRQTNLEFIARAGTEDLAEIVVVASGFEYNLGKINLPKNPVIIDLGGHIGTFSIFIARMLKNKCRIYAFEPDQENYKLLLKNISLNKNTSTKTENTAISDYNGKGYLVKDNLNNDAYHLDFQNKKEINCDVKTLKKVIRDYKLKEIDLLKIDIEGGEYKIFMDKSSFTYIKENVKYMFMEYHDIDDYYNYGLIRKRIEENFFILDQHDTALALQNKKYRF